jgi:hypothetical protein
MRRKSVLPSLLSFFLSLNAQTPSSDVKTALNSIHASELKGDLSFLASDLLQGRYTPSPGLEIAAEFIASKFRAIGLQPGGTSAYFQLADMVDRKMPTVAAPLTAHAGNQPLTVEPDKIQVTKVSTAAHILDAPVLKVAERDPAKLEGLNLDGKVVLVPMPDFATMAPADRMHAYQQLQAFDKLVAGSKALLELVLTKSPGRPAGRRLLFAQDAQTAAPPIVQVESPELAEALTTPTTLIISLDIPAPEDQSVTVKNVIGVLPGADPLLKSTAVLVTAHYDHIGTTDTAGNLAESKAQGADKIFNGANDDGSGTVSVIEIARVLSQLHPKRSIVFITFFGEERGLLGSTYYGNHPLFPLAKTVADINLEQVGRTDSSEGSEIANASITGYDYSDVTKYLEDAGKATGIKIYQDPAASDQYFVRSDNAALAEQGVPAHTLTTAFEYPDYHGVGDEWQKIDYSNMAKVDRAVAFAVFNIANSRVAPKWNLDNPKTEPFREAQKKLR